MKNTIVMFNDAYDVLLFKGENDILKSFMNFKARIVFGAEIFCTPNEDLSSKYPSLGDNLGKLSLAKVEI